MREHTITGRTKLRTGLFVVKRIEISNRKVGKDQPCFVIAEAGVNHNGDVDLARKLIKVASEAKADAVKFQTWITDEIVTRTTPKPRYQKETTSDTESQYEMLKRLELSEEEFTYLAGYAKDLSIIFLSTPEGKRCTDFLERLGVPAYKVGSADLNNFPHLEYVAKKKKPIILSTGMASYSEVKEAVDLIRSVGNQEIALLHCTSSYPTRIEDVNLHACIWERIRFKGIRSAVIRETDSEWRIGHTYGSEYGEICNEHGRSD